MEPTQAHRRIAIATGLGEDAVLLRSLRGEERLGRVFRYEMELGSTQPVDFDDLLGTNVCARVSIGDEEDRDSEDDQRFINGYVSGCEYVGRSGRYLLYRIEVVPWLWFLSRSVDCKIYQEQSVPDIIKSVFRDCGFSDFEENLTANAYEPWEYCVQYRESHLRFVQRLMEQEGIYYYFRHEADRHTLVLCDSISGHTAHPAASELIYEFDRRESEAIGSGMMTVWNAKRTVQPGSYAHRDFDFKLPNNDLLARSENPREHANNVGEIYDYPGEYVQQSSGESLASRRLEELQVDCETFRGETTSRAVACGATFALLDHPQEALNTEYLVTAVRLDITGDDFESSGGGGGGGGEDFYACAVEAIRKVTPFRTGRVTDRPMIPGPQTAIVVGKSDEEITVDEHGRVKVQFHWDRDAPGDETASCWVRVSQGWAGKNWGAMFIPRHGQEVIVEFLEGDPDRPIITGRVYNGENGPPYDPRSHATMSTIKSNSSKGGEGFNEWRFEDKKDKEQIFVHAQRRMDVRVRGSEYETTYGSRHVRVGWEKDGDRGGDLDLFVRQNHNRHIEADTYIWYGEESGNVYTRIEGDFKSHVVLNSEHLVKETYSLQSADELHMVENTASFYTTNFIAHGTNGVDIRSDASLFLTGINGVEILADSDAKLAGGSVHIKGGSAVNIEASSGINLKCGGSFIAISSSGVHISGPIVGLNSGGSAGPAQGAEEAVEGEQLEEVEFEGPLDAVVADDGKPGSIGGTGTRSRTRPSFSEGPMVPMPPPPPPNTGPGRNESPGEECEEPRVISIEWVEDEVYCSEFANLRGDIANCPDQTTLPIEIVEDTDRSTYHQDDASISGNSYSYRWKVIDVVPTQCPQEHEDLDGKAEAERTADPLRVKFIPDLTKTRYTRNRAHYDMEVKDFVIELTEDLKFVKGWAGFAAQLGTHVPAGTGGEISPWRFGGGYRWVKKTGTRFHYWNGSSWVLITLSDNDLEATGFTVGFYKNGANYTCQYGGNWPEAFSPDWNIDAANHQQKIRQWVQSMHDKWTRKFDLKRKQCESTLDECCRYEIVANPTMTKQATFREGYLIVTVGNDNNVMRSNDSLFFIDDADIDMAAHEFGHHLGNPDEYAGAAIDTSLNGDGATNGIDYTSVMGRSNQPAKKRHFGTIAAHMKKMVKDQIGKTYDYDVEPHTP